jgi:hypothetical protein
MSIAQHHAAVKDYDRYVQCDREGCEKWHDAPQFRDSENFFCDMLSGQRCAKPGDDRWIKETAAFWPHARKRENDEAEASFCQQHPCCEVAARHLLHNINSRTKSFWPIEGDTSVGDVIDMTNTAESLAKDGPDRIEELKKILLAITRGVNQECKRKDADWKRIDEQINQVCLELVCIGTRRGSM